MTDNITKWLLTGEVGVSSKTMAAAACGIINKAALNHPHDPDDLNRCIKLVDAAPEVKDAFDKIATISKEWAGIIQNWDDLRASFIEEVGYDWNKGGRAPKTYDKMQKIIYGK